MVPSAPPPLARQGQEPSHVPSLARRTEGPRRGRQREATVPVSVTMPRLASTRSRRFNDRSCVPVRTASCRPAWVHRRVIGQTELCGRVDRSRFPVRDRHLNQLSVRSGRLDRIVIWCLCPHSP
jgi:hypothetical protein